LSNLIIRNLYLYIINQNSNAMNYRLRRTAYTFSLFFIPFLSQAQTTNTYTTAATWNVPAGVSSISIKVYGGAGGTGGQDCGAGCTNAAAGPVGYVLASYNVTPGDVVGIYPGTKGGNGASAATGTGGGSGGTDTYPPLNFNGGTGGNAGSTGSSGAGGGGGAASVVTINSIIKIVAGGAGGGGGMANAINSGLAGSSSTSPNGTSNTGGNGTIPSGDGGGGGGGGGGQFGSVGGGVYAAGGESAGIGGFIGGNSVSGASLVTTNGNISWTNTGQIEITFLSTLPVTWLSFTATKQSSGIALNWSTAIELNTKDYTVQRSVNGATWGDISIVPAVGNSNTVQQYSFIDKNPISGLNYYRLLQRDADGKINYSKIVSVDFTDVVRLLKIYPNPVFNGTTMISLKEASVVGVYNSIGAKLIEREFPAGDHPFNLSPLPKGTYYMKVKEEAVLFVIQ
jgi:hypothetical protein